MVRSGSRRGERHDIEFKQVNSTMYHSVGEYEGQYFLYKSQGELLFPSQLSNEIQHRVDGT